MRRNHRAALGRTTLAWSLASALATSCTGATEPAGARRLEALTPTNLTGTAGTRIEPAPVVRVTNDDGTPVPGITVSFAVDGGGSIGNASAQTDASGTASIGEWILGTVASTYTVTARSSGLADVVFTARANAGPVALIEPYSGNYQAALAGAPVPSPLRVKVSDQYGNPVGGAHVTFEVTSGNGTIDGSAATTDASGLATSGAWTLGPSAGTQHARARAQGSQTIEALFTAAACGIGCLDQQLVFVRTAGIFRTTFIGGSATQLTSGRDAFPAWSPDGSRIAFSRYDQAGVGDLYLMNNDGSGAVRRAAAPASSGAGGYHAPAWSPDSRTIAVGLGNCYYDCDIWLLSADDDGSAPVHLVTRAADPAWSPDGKKIAFVSLSGDDGYHALHVVNADGTGGVSVISARDAGFIGRPTWSPDGTRIAFSKCLAASCDIRVAQSDGSGVRQITVVGNADEPAWSPDGIWLAVTLWSFSGGVNNSSMAYVSADSGGVPIPIVSPAWSPAWRPAPQAARPHAPRD